MSTGLVESRTRRCAPDNVCCVGRAIGSSATKTIAVFHGNSGFGRSCRGIGFRQQRLTRIPRGKSLLDVTVELQQRLVDERAVDVVDDTELAALNPAPAHWFDVRAHRVAAVTAGSSLQVDGATYSLPESFARATVGVFVGAFAVDVTPGGVQVRLPRARFGEKHVKYLHYAKALSEKPQAVRQCAPRQLEEMGEPFMSNWKALVEKHDEVHAARIFCRVSRDASSVHLHLVAARFPERKTLADFDAQAVGVEPGLVAQRASCVFVERSDNVAILGPVGTGKTHLATALGIEACRRRKRVVFVRAADIVRQLIEPREQRELGRLYRRLRRANVLIVDELGLVPLDRVGGELLFNLFLDRHRKGSIVVTSNLAFGEWAQVLGGNEKLTAALLDRPK
jgi:DNA replication protein DnaC